MSPVAQLIIYYEPDGSAKNKLNGFGISAITKPSGFNDQLLLMTPVDQEKNQITSVV